MVCIGTMCSKCNCKVYIMERLVVEHKLFHRACFKCCKCAAGLRPGTYTYDMETETFYCIYECLGDFKKTQEEIRIKLQPITDKVFDALDKASQTVNGSHSKKSSWNSGTQGNTLGPPFSIVKKNVISIGSLDKSFEDHSNTRRRSSSVGKHTSSKRTLGLPVDNDLKKSHSANALNLKEPQVAVEVKHENGKVKSIVKINPIQNKQSSFDESSDERKSSDSGESSKPKSSWKEKAKGPVGLNDAYLREEEEKPQEGSVNKLRMKFMNIDNIIENKHRQNVAKKNERIQREIRRVVPGWNDKDHPNNTSKEDSSGTSKSLDSDCDSLGTSSGQSSTSQMEEKQKTNKSQIIVNVSSVKSNSSSSIGSPSQTKTKTSSEAVQGSHTTSTTRTIPIIVKPSLDSDSDREQSRIRSASQSSSTPSALSPSSESSFSEVPNSPMSLTGDRWGSQTFLDDDSDNLPKMSIIIAQEASSTKINSRYFTVETCEGKEKHVIFEDKELETVDVEGEFKFGDEEHRYTKAQQDILRSLSNCKITRNKSDLVKDEEVLLSPLEIMDELNALGTLLTELEKRGVEMEERLRNSLKSAEHSLENEDELMREWLTLVQEKNIILRRESELIYLLKFHQYEDRYLVIECELRALLSIKDEAKTVENIKRERELMAELFSLVQRRTSIMDKLEEDKLREKQEEENTKQHLDVDGLHETWGQKQDYTKVAFSRFYC